jgi:hypothetical protein
MKPTHLTDTEIQQYVLQAADSSPAAIEHVRHCESCQARAREYTLLFNAVAEQTRPAFDFDLPEMVMSQLVKPKASPVGQRLMVSCVWLVSAAFFGMTILLFGDEFRHLFSGGSSIVFYTTMTLAAALTIVLVMESFREYHGKMKKLNFN